MPSFEVINCTVAVPGKVVTKLDEFVLEATTIIEKHTPYIIISGYVSIFFGRARGTEDVDIFIGDLEFNQFEELYDAFVKAGFDCTAEKRSAYHDYLKDHLPICFWKKNLPLLRIEMKIASKPSQRLQLKDRIKVEFDGHALWMSAIESQIAYKRFIARSEKDLQDARHLEIVFPNLDKEKVKSYKDLFLQENA